MFLKITSVDHHSYNGREHHPADSDIGLRVRLVKVEALVYGPLDVAKDGGPVVNPDSLTPEVLAVLFDDSMDSQDHGENYVEYCYTCVTEDGRVLELMDEEVQPLR